MKRKSLFWGQFLKSVRDMRTCVRKIKTNSLIFLDITTLKWQ